MFVGTCGGGEQKRKGGRGKEVGGKSRGDGRNMVGRRHEEGFGLLSGSNGTNLLPGDGNAKF